METARLVLRPHTAADVDLLVALDADPEVMRFLTGGRPTSRETVAGEVLPELLALRPPYGQWAAHERASGAFVGWFGLKPVPGAPDAVELGYRLRREVWGQGYATEGARAVVDRAFADPAVERVTAQTMTVNSGSRRVMEKVGLTYVRTFFLDWPETIEGSEHGDVEYAVTRKDWFRRTECAASSGCDRRADLERS